MTHRPNPVQSIAQHRQQFSQQQRPPLPPMLGGTQQPQPTAEAAIQAQMHELSLEIYVRIVSDRLTDCGWAHKLEPQQMQQIAADSQAAARAYFKQLGVQFHEGVTDGQS